MPSHKQLITWGGALTLLILSIPVAHAAPGDIFDQSVQTAISTFMGQVVQYLNIGTWTIFTLIMMLLNPQVMFDLGAGGSLVTMLNQIWQLARDLMNVIFAFLLVAAAIYTVIKADKSFISENVGKFVMAVVLVNFSWFFPRVILDVANVATSAIYGIPSLLTTQCRQVLSGKAETVNGQPRLVPPPDGQQCVPINAGAAGTADPLFSCACVVVDNATFFPTPAQVTALRNADPRWQCDTGLMCRHTVVMNPNTMSSVTTTLNGLVINHARLGTLARMPSPIGAGNVGEMIAFVMRQLVVFVIHVALFFPLLAMAVAFLIRIPVLWITIAFMPFYFLTYLPFMDKVLANFSPKEKLMDNFLAAAFLPAVTAVPLAIGYTMINAALIMPAGALGGISYPLISGINSLYQIIWLAMSLGVMWVGVFAALETGKFSKAITDKIRETGKGYGQVAAKLPLAMPLPMPGSQSLLQLAQKLKPQTLNYALSQGKLGDVLKSLGSQDKLDLHADTRKIIEKKIEETPAEKRKIEAALTAAARPDAKSDVIINLRNTVRQNSEGKDINDKNLVDILMRLQKDGKLNTGLTPQQFTDLRAKVDEALNPKPPAPQPNPNPNPNPGP